MSDKPNTFFLAIGTYTAPDGRCRAVIRFPDGRGMHGAWRDSKAKAKEDGLEALKLIQQDENIIVRAVGSEGMVQ